VGACASVAPDCKRQPAFGTPGKRCGARSDVCQPDRNAQRRSFLKQLQTLGPTCRVKTARFTFTVARSGDPFDVKVTAPRPAQACLVKALLKIRLPMSAAPSQIDGQMRTRDNQVVSSFRVRSLPSPPAPPRKIKCEQGGPGLGCGSPGQPAAFPRR
jgi:hypothetical protein